MSLLLPKQNEIKLSVTSKRSKPTKVRVDGAPTIGRCRLILDDEEFVVREDAVIFEVALASPRVIPMKVPKQASSNFFCFTSRVDGVDLPSGPLVTPFLLGPILVLRHQALGRGEDVVLVSEAMGNPPTDELIGSIEGASIEEEVIDLLMCDGLEAQPPAPMAVDGLEARVGSGAFRMEVTVLASAPSMIEALRRNNDDLLDRNVELLQREANRQAVALRTMVEEAREAERATLRAIDVSKALGYRDQATVLQKEVEGIIVVIPRDNLQFFPALESPVVSPEAQNLAKSSLEDPASSSSGEVAEPLGEKRTRAQPQGMDRYQRVEKPRNETPISENEIRITAQGRMRNYISYGMSLLEENGHDEIVIKAMGRAINKTVMVVELIKRRIGGLHQITCTESIDITDTWEPLEEGLLPLETTRHVSMITITLSKKALDTSSTGYQPPIPDEEVRPAFDYEQEESFPAGRGRGRGGRRGRGRARARRLPPSRSWAWQGKMGWATISWAGPWAWSILDAMRTVSNAHAEASTRPVSKKQQANNTLYWSVFSSTFVAVYLAT
ncbi:hypothetical protein GUJ93_ZPchr0011g28889 [Zizania palustris]|uniref:DNA/RNA-binding protein Alba-like domain-containing protein n=1 Tax=Zizania palustris TaxID=103762 RepID=A0A8J6BKH2_ZIZPA|nr:hypothetical protein GUJ93_ZPchr0011g28889 [Zizania palustris]